VAAPFQVQMIGLDGAALKTSVANQIFVCPMLRMHDGATIAQVEFRFMIVAHSALPEQMPAVRIFRADSTGVATPLQSMSAGADVNGFRLLPKVALDQWQPTSTSKSFVYVCDQNNSVDLSSFAYGFEIQDEAGTGSETGNTWNAVVATFTGITDQHFQ
jgi:hypothetical protein